MDDELFESFQTIANQYIEEEKYKEALPYYEKLIEYDNSKEELYLKKALCERNLEQYNKAIEDYKKAIKLNPKNIENLINLVKLLSIKGEFSDAVDYMLILMELDPENKEYIEQLSLIQETQEEIINVRKKEEEGKNLEVAKTCKKILLESPECLEVQLMFAKILLNNNNIEEAIYFINNKIGEENRKIKNFDYYLAKCLYYDGKFNESKGKLNELINEITDDDEIYSTLKKDSKYLLNLIDKITTLKSKADKLYEEEKYEEAINEYNKILTIDDSNKKFNSLIDSQISLCNQKINKSLLSSLNKYNQSCIENFDSIKVEDKPKPKYGDIYKIDEEDEENKENEENEENEEDLDLNNKESFEAAPYCKKNEQNKIEENKINIPPELYKFLKCFPCVLKSDCNDNIESYNSCLNEIPKNKIEFQVENKFTSMKIENNDNYAIINNIDVSAGISFYYNDLKFKGNKNDSHNFERKSSSFIVKRKLYSITVKEEDISFRPLFLKKIEKIAKISSSDEEKAQKLNDLFKETGFYVPLKAYIGGLYNLGELSEKDKYELQKNIEVEFNGRFKNINLNKKIGKKYDSEKINELFKNSKVFIGGEICENFEEWISSVNINNSDIIEYTEFRKIYEFLDENLEIKLNKPIELIKQKYKRRESYFEILKELKDNKGQSYYNRSNDLKIGICEIKNPNIYCYDEISFYQDSGLFKRARKNIYKAFNDIIIGLEVINKWNDGTNGDYNFDNPILKKEIDINFISKRWEKMGFEIKVYLMKFPE